VPFVDTPPRVHGRNESVETADDVTGYLTPCEWRWPSKSARVSNLIIRTAVPFEFFTVFLPFEFGIVNRDECLATSQAFAGDVTRYSPEVCRASRMC
jgi:hypothetical protein